MTTASGISMGQPQQPHASTSTTQSSTIAAASSEGQDNNTKEKLSLSKTNSDETEVEKNPRPSQPLRPSCLSPQAKEWGLCLLLLLRQNPGLLGEHTSKFHSFSSIKIFYAVLVPLFFFFSSFHAKLSQNCVVNSAGLKNFGSLCSTSSPPLQYPNC